ncbi:MAG: amino acid permease [Candidatus Krumholzibacteriia bacterium]
MHLQRKLGPFALTSIVVANMIGAGIFTTSGLLLQELGDPALMLVLWAVGGAVALCGALAYGELGAAIPRAGGEYAFLSRLYHPLLGFLTGWVSLFAGFSAPIAASAIGFTAYLTRAFPALLSPGWLPPDREAALLPRIYAVAVIAAFTLIHRRGLDLSARVQNGLTALKVALIVGLLATGFALGDGDFGHLEQDLAYPADPAGAKSVGLALMWIMFSYSGWNAAAYLGGEARRPERSLPRSLLLGTALVTVLYLGLNLLYVYAVDPAAMAGVIPVAALAVDRLFGSGWERWLSLLLSAALFSSLSAYIILGPRVYYAMAQDGLFFRFAARVHPRFGVPSRAIVLQGVLASLMVLVGTFDQILTYMGFALGIFPVLAVIGLRRLRRRPGGSPRLPGRRWAPPVYVIASITVLALAFLERPLESSIALATLAAGVPVYGYFRSRSRGHS